jgi:hypothetical protein
VRWHLKHPTGSTGTKPEYIDDGIIKRKNTTQKLARLKLVRCQYIRNTEQMKIEANPSIPNNRCA